LLTHRFIQRTPYSYTPQQKIERVVQVSPCAHMKEREKTSWYTIKPKVPCHHCEHEKSSYMTVSLLAVVQFGVPLYTRYEMPLTCIFTLFTSPSIQ
jgi:hypothetical protein